MSLIEIFFFCNFCLFDFSLRPGGQIKDRLKPLETLLGIKEDARFFISYLNVIRSKNNIKLRDSVRNQTEITSFFFFISKKYQLL